MIGPADGLARALRGSRKNVWIDRPAGVTVWRTKCRQTNVSESYWAKGLDMCTSAFLARGCGQPELVAVERRATASASSGRVTAGRGLRTPGWQLIRLVLNKHPTREGGSVVQAQKMVSFEVWNSPRRCATPGSVITGDRSRYVRECASALTALKCNLKQVMLDFNNLRTTVYKSWRHEGKLLARNMGLRSNALSEGTDLARMLHANRA